MEYLQITPYASMRAATVAPVPPTRATRGRPSEARQDSPRGRRHHSRRAPWEAAQLIRRRPRPPTAPRSPGDRPQRQRTGQRHRPPSSPAREGTQTTKLAEQPVVLRCACGADFTLSARRARDYRNTGRTPACVGCRWPEPSPTVTDATRAWWLERYTIDEIRELAAEAFGP
jgi:hypothetical protein